MKTASKDTTTPRRRRQRQSDEQVELLDEGDQDKLIQELREQNDKQQDQIQSLFRILSICVAMISLLSAVLVQYRRRHENQQQSASVLRWVHAALSALLHYNSNIIIIADDHFSSGNNNLSWKIYKPAAVTVLLAAIALYFARRTSNDDDDVYLHRGLVLSNVVTIAAAYWLRHDRMLSETALQDLKSSKYRYKSL